LSTYALVLVYEFILLSKYINIKQNCVTHSLCYKRNGSSQLLLLWNWRFHSHHEMLLRVFNDQFSLIYLYYCCHKHLLRNTIKNQLDRPDHCHNIYLLPTILHDCIIWRSDDRASWLILRIKPNRCTNFSNLFLE